MPQVMSPLVLNYTPSQPNDAVRLQDLQTASAPPSYPPSGEAQTGGTWTDGKPVYREVLTAPDMTPGASGTVLGTVTDFDKPVRFEGYGSVDASALTGFIPLNGSGFSMNVMPDGQVKIFGPDGVMLHNVWVIVDYLKA
jgi:hypothetical protein